MVLGSFGDGQNLVGEGEMFIEDEAKVASRVSGVKWGVKLLFESSE